MRVLLLIATLCLVISACSEDHICPHDLTLAELGADDPECEQFVFRQVDPMPDDLYMQGMFNGEKWDLDLALLFGLDAPNSPFNISGEEYNKCGIAKYIVSFSNGILFPGLNNRVYPSGFRIAYNYGDLHDPHFTARYDSLLQDEIENYLEIHYLSPDSTIMEGTFQIHVMKSDTNRYGPGEPREIKITDGKFRIKKD